MSTSCSVPQMQHLYTGPSIWCSRQSLTSRVQVVDLIKEYNTLGRNCVALMLDTKGPEVRSGDLSAPIDLVPGARLLATWGQVWGHAGRLPIRRTPMQHNAAPADTTGA